MKHSWYCSLISVPMMGGRSLSSRIPKKKAVNLYLIFRTMAKFLCVTKPTSSWNDLLCSMYGTELAAFYFKIVLTILDPITSVTNLLSYITSKLSCSYFAFLKEFSNLLMFPPCPGSMNILEGGDLKLYIYSFCDTKEKKIRSERKKFPFVYNQITNKIQYYIYRN